MSRAMTQGFSQGTGRALIVGASGGIGAAMQACLAARGYDVTGLSRASDDLDITQEASVARVLAPLQAPFDLIFVATGALAAPGRTPEKSLSALSPEALSAQMAVNALGPLLVLKHARRLLPKDRRAVFAALSARVGSIGDNRLGGWYSYRASKAALNQMLRSAAIEMARSHRQLCVAALHPGTVATRFTVAYQDRHDTVPAEVAAARLADVLEGLTPAQTGGFYDYHGQEIAF